MSSSPAQLPNGHSTLERASYIVGLSAALLAFAPFKDSWGAFSIPVFGFPVTLYVAGLIFLALLLLSAYLYGLNNIRYSIPFLLETSWTQYLEVLALTVYITALAFPLLVAILFCVSFILNMFSGYSYEHLAALSTSIGVLIGAATSLLSALVSTKFYKKERNAIAEDLRDLSRRSESRTEESYSSGDLRISLLSMYQALISAVKSYLILEIGTQTAYLPEYQLIRIASDKGLIRPEERAAVEDLRGIRNLIAHKTDEAQISDETFINLQKVVKPIILRLQTPRH